MSEHFRIVRRTDDRDAPRAVPDRSGPGEDGPFDRQERIGWWSQERLRQARVLVAGAGAIGNETLKNLALLGIGSIFICDMDDISVSNLSRAVLFRREDAGRRKAETAARRVRELALEESCAVDFFDGDIVWYLGSGVFRHFDVVLGCLDNVETRMYVNRCCRRVRKPWVDAGIGGLAGSVKVFGTGDGEPCFACFATEEDRRAARRRWSCDDFKRELLERRIMPATQISSALVSAVQVQEAVKLLMGRPCSVGKKLFFQGDTCAYEEARLRRDPGCCEHTVYTPLRETPLTNDATARELLEHAAGMSGPGAELVLTRDFLRRGRCACGHSTVFNAPRFRVYERDVRCGRCGRELRRGLLETAAGITLESGGELLDMTLRELGIPAMDIVQVNDAEGREAYYELTGDGPRVMPRIWEKRSRQEAERRRRREP